MRVIPTFFAITPERIGSIPLEFRARGTAPYRALIPLELDLDVDAGGQIELHQSIDRLRGRIDDVEQTLVRAHLELLAALLVDVRRPVDRKLFDPRRQRNGAADVGTGALGRRHDFPRRGVEHSVIKRLQADADILSVHASLPCSGAARAYPAPATDRFKSKLLFDGDDDAGTDGAAAFTDSEAQLLFHGDRHDQLDIDRDVVARHDHLGAFRQRHDARHVRRAEVELRTVVGEERRVTATFVLGQDVGFGDELLVRLHRARLGQNLATLDTFTVNAAQQRADVVAGLALVEQLAEHLDARAGRLGGRTDADDFQLLANLDDAALDAAGHHRATARDREHVLDRHQERLVERTNRRRDVGIDRRHQLADRVLADLLVGIFQRGQCRALDDRNVVAGELVLGQELANLELDQLQQLGVIDLV